MSCQENAISGGEASPSSDAQLQIYLDRFEVEATSRGIDADLSQMGIYAIFEDLESTILGNCSYDPNGNTRLIRIDPVAWSGMSDLSREHLVFHELGHCFLERSHDDSRTGNTCNSIMHSGNKTNCRLAYNLTTRNHYLNELFNTE